MTPLFHPAARLEYRESILFYEAARPGLGAEFTHEIEAAVAKICDAPLQHRAISPRLRRYLVRRFPFAVLYAIENDVVLIMAIMHGSRKPGYWQQRLG